MTFFSFSQPLLCEKQEDLDFQDLEGLIRLDWQIGKIKLFSGFYPPWYYWHGGFKLVLGSVERLRWLVYSWVALMLGGVALTDMGIFCGWGEVLMPLCPIWLGLSAIGYLFMYYIRTAIAPFY